MALNNYTDKFISLSNLRKFWEGVSGKITAVDNKFAGYYTKGEVDGIKTGLEGQINGKVSQADYNAQVALLATKSELSSAQTTLQGKIDEKLDASVIDGYYKKGEVDGQVTSINGEIARVEGLFAGYYDKNAIDGKVSTINTEVGKKLAAADFNSTIANYSTTSDVQGLIAAAQASDKTAWEAADAALKLDLEGQIAAVAHLKLQKVDSKESVESPKSDVIYLVPEDGATGTFVEYIYVDGAWERIGTTAADFSNYYTKEDVNGKVTTLEASIAEAAGKGQQGITDAAAALAAANEGQRLAGVAQDEVDALEGVVAELTSTVGSNKTAAENAIAAVDAKLGAGFDSSNTVAKAIADINTSIENAVAGGVNSVLLKNTDLGKALEASGAGNVELDIKALVEGYATDSDLTSAVTTLEGAIGDHESAVETWAASIAFATDAEIEGIFTAQPQA